MIKVIVSGAAGKMGRQVLNAVALAPELEIVGGYDPGVPGMEINLPGTTVVCSGDLEALIKETSPDVMVDFTRPDVVEDNVRLALSYNVNCVIGTTGVTAEKFEHIYQEINPQDAALFIAPNFTTGAVLMMVFAKAAAKFFPDAEIIEFHHNQKKDAPSGTAYRTAELIAEGRDHAAPVSPGKESEIDGCEGARGAEVCGVTVHSVRSDGYVAHQEVIFGSAGQTLTIRHDSIDRASYMPGVVLAIKEVGNLNGVVVGLEKLMGLEL